MVRTSAPGSIFLCNFQLRLCHERAQSPQIASRGTRNSLRKPEFSGQFKKVALKWNELRLKTDLFPGPERRIEVLTVENGSNSSVDSTHFESSALAWGIISTS